MNDKLKINDKIISLYKFIEEFCKVKNKIITNDENYIWNYKIDNIPEDEENISLEYSDKTDDDDSSDDLNYLLKVHKPEFQKCPEPPEELKKWLLDDWNYHKNDAKIRQQIELKNSGEENVKFENFDDDPNRRILYEEWLEKRNNWVDKQRKIEKTRDFFTELYMKYIDLQRDSETIEIIIANGYIKDNNNPNIFHPILTKRLNMSFDASDNTMYILNTNAKSELYTELFQVMEDINLESLSTLNTDLTKNDYHPMDRNDTKEFLKVLVHKISSDSKFVDEDEEEDNNNNRILMFYKPSIIIRKRLDGTIKAIEQIIKNIEENGFIPPHLLDIVNGGVLEKPEESEETVEELLAKTGGESVDILLTKEANKEQLEIAKRIDMYNAVLVQGPPGTGKTHTIANLVGDFLAKGKSILVTSYTKKALTVLKEKLPKNMQSLCVSVLDDSNEDMENSIDGITEYMSKYTSFELAKQKDELKQDRLKIIDELSKNRKKIYDILNTEYKSIVLNGEEISPSDAASFVLENKEKLNYINGKIKLYSPIPLSEEELNYLYSTNGKISGDEEKELNYKLPNPDVLIRPKAFSDSLNEINKLKEIISTCATNKNWKVNIEKDIFFETNFGKFYIPNLNFDNINELKLYIDKYNSLESWCVNICCDGKKGGAYKKRWITLISKIKSTVEINEHILDKYFGKSLTCKIEDLIPNKNSIVKLKGMLEKNKKLNKLNLLFNSDLNKILSLNAINNSTIKTVEDCDYILKNIELCSARNELSVIWNELMANNGLKDFFELDENEPEKLAEKYIDNIEYYLNWYSNDYKELLDLLSKNSIPDQIILRINSLDSDLEHVKKIFNALNNDLPYIVNICINKINISRINDVIDKSIDLLDDNLLINSALCINMKTSLINCDDESYLKQFKELEETYNKYEVLFKRNELMKKIEEVAPTWASDIRNRIGIHGQNTCPSNIKDAWKYKQLDLILESLTSESIDLLQKKSQKLSKEYRKITEEYAEKCAWYELLSKTECDIDMKQALKGWELTIKKIGKGTGKNAEKHKAQARDLMAKCQNAVPCWIMPINKAIESLKPGENEFDIIIIDEASQSDISSLAIAYLGKKMIVVGDDKQVSPMAIGTEIDKINALEQMYIKDKIPNSHLYGSKTSLYDIAATTFQPLMLKEHFRCVPEIIGFSNMLSYDYKIKPLRDSSSSNLLPAVINYRVDGKRIGKTNRIEAETIVSQIKACLTIEEYKDKTFGVISLLGDEQVKLIQTLMFKYIDPKDIENRKILVGNASNFQGDERDVIFLSMVDSSNENGGPLSFSGPGVEDSTKKRYNVAVSRAKDQLWVVNSLDAANDLKPGDIRKKLLDYATNPDAFAFKEEEIKKKADSIFEVQVANKLVSEGYHITQQYPVGAYRLDIVAIYKNSKVVIECDGERYHSGDEKVREDMQRQAILERIGWRFIRIRGSQYFKNPEAEMTRVIEQLNTMGIYPEDEQSYVNNRTSELLEKLKLESSKYLSDIQEGKEPEIEYKDILYALDSNKNINKLKSLNNYISNKNNEKDNNNVSFNLLDESLKKNLLFDEKVDICGPSQFKYMSLYSNGISRKQIAEYFAVAYDTVKKSLQAVARNYNVFTVDECIEKFKKEYQFSNEYQEILKDYYNKFPNKPTNDLNLEKELFDNLLCNDEENNNEIGFSSNVNSLFKELDDNDIEYIDNREKSGIVWIIDSRDKFNIISGLIDKYGLNCTIEKRGSIVTENRPAWRVMIK